MGLFEKAGRRFEQFKRRANEAAAEEADYECGDCGERLYADAETCPACGAAAVESLAPDDGEDDDEGDDHDEATAAADEGETTDDDGESPGR